MFKKKAIQCAGKSKIFWKETGKKRPSKLTAFLDVLVSYVLLFILTYGCILVYNSVFTVDGLRRTLLFCIGIVEAILFFLYLLPATKKTAPLWAIGGYLLGFLFFRKSIISGLKLCGNELFLWINDYYGTDFPGFTDIDKSQSNLTAVCFLSLLFLWWFVTALLYFKNNLLLSLPALLLLCGELLLGMAPGEIPVAVTAVGLFSLMPYGKGKHIENPDRASGVYAKAAVLLSSVIALSFFFTMTNTKFRNNAETLTALQDTCLTYQYALEQQFFDYITIGFSNEGWSRISNTAPQYEEKDVISISTDRLPQDSLYLRGYVGDTYRNGNWSNRSQIKFDNAISDLTNRNQKNAGTYILNLFYETQSTSPFYRQTQYSISYLDLNDNYAYLPYLTDLNSVYTSEQIVLSLPVKADAMLYRNEQDSLLVNGIAPTYQLYHIQESTSYAKTTAIENFYESYLPLYLNVPDGLTRIKQLGEELSEELETEYENSWSNYGIAGSKELYAAYLVSKTLSERTTYSLALDRVPFGTDVVEYFLFDSGEGFCQHYASAGVLLLREMGIPARYVTGYIVNPNDFVLSSDGGYTAAIKDSAAHSWAEIFIEHIGWVPIEMTESSSYPFFSDSTQDFDLFENIPQTESNTDPGYDHETLIENETEDIQADSGTESENDLPNQETEVDDQEVQQDEENPQKHEENTQNSEKDTLNHNQETQNNDENTPNYGSSTENEDGEYQLPSVQENNNANNGLLTLLSIICSVMIIAILFRFCFVKLDKRRTKAFQQKNYRRAIQEIASYTNRLLRRKGILIKRNLDDKSYRETLINGLPLIPEEELELYFTALQRAAYSNETLTKTDVISCYTIYKKIKYLNKKKHRKK